MKISWSMWGLLPECSVSDPGWRQLKLKHALCFYRPSTAGCSQTVQIWTVVEVTSGKCHLAWTALINATNSAHDFSVKLSPGVCSYMAGICVLGYLWCGLSYLCVLKFGLRVDSDKSCYMPWQISKPPVCCSFRLALRWWIIPLVFQPGVYHLYSLPGACH